jgi:hypothetical protein
MSQEEKEGKKEAGSGEKRREGGIQVVCLSM